MTRLISRSLVACCLLAGCSSTEPQGEQPSRLAFQVMTQAGGDIMISLADGSDAHPIASHPANDASPQWSPDARRLVFESDRDGNSEIYIVKENGIGLHNLSNDSGEDRFPTWSPDGRSVLFASNRHQPGGELALHVMRADGSGVHMLSPTPILAERPRWSRDGSTILYLAAIGPIGRAVFLASADGSNIRQLTFPDSTQSDWSPAWAPDGQSILFARSRFSAPVVALHIMSVAAAGGAPVPFPAAADTADFDPAFSPDGSTVVFVRQAANAGGPTGPPRLFIMTAGGANIQPLPLAPDGFDVDWSAGQ